MNKWMFAALAAFLLVAPLTAMATEQPRYDALVEDGPFELRQYAPTIVAEVTIEGERDTALNRGFRSLAGYIFGGNHPAQRIAMTAPVEQGAAGSEKIAMTSPVSAQADQSTWRVRFTMPSAHTMSTLPTPDDPQVRLIEVPARRVAVVRFSGIRTDALLAERTEALREFIRARGLEPIGGPVYAFYDPPWTLPFLRRNEVQWVVAAR